MKTIQLYRSDFGGQKDSEGAEYFDQLVSQLGKKPSYLIDFIEMTVNDCTFYNDEGQPIDMK